MRDRPIAIVLPDAIRSGKPVVERVTADGNGGTGSSSARASGGATVTVNVEFMGIIADLAGCKAVSLPFAEVPTLREMFAELERRYGPDFAARIYRTAEAPRRLQMCARIFVNNALVDDSNLDLPIPVVADRPSSSEVLVFILPAACGG